MSRSNLNTLVSYYTLFPCILPASELRRLGQFLFDFLGLNKSSHKRESLGMGGSTSKNRNAILSLMRFSRALYFHGCANKHL